MAAKSKSYVTGVGAAIWLAMVGSLAVPAAAAGPHPQRIVSLNLCADQYLLALADRSQIAALSRNARDPELSAAAAETAGLRIVKGSAEEVLMLRPDLVVGTQGRRSMVMAALAGEHYATLDLPPADSYDAILAQIRLVARAVGHRERGEALIAGMNRQLAAIRRPRRGGVAAYYQRRGYLTGTGTLIDDLMRRTGLVNLATKLGKPALSQISLEQLMVARPDYLIVETATDRVTDQGTEMLHHPLLRRIKRLRLPQAWTVCGGPTYVDAARSLARQLDADR